MKRLAQEVLLVLCIGTYVAVGLTWVRPDPCDPVLPISVQSPQTERPCEENDGVCYDRRCERCPGHWRHDLCPGRYSSCCLPEPEPEYRCCEIYSDPHVRNFDGLSFDVQLPGWFRVAAACCLPDEFSLWAQFAYPYAGASWTETIAIMVLYKNTLIEVSETGDLQINGNPTDIPYTSGDISVTQVGGVIIIKLGDIDVEIHYNINTKRLKVCVGSRWFDKLCGICGNANGNVNDDKDDIPTPPPDGPDCPHPHDHHTWTDCRNALEAITKNSRCSYKSIERYLKQCAFDACADTRMGSRMTLEAAREQCASRGPGFANEKRPVDFLTAKAKP